MKKILMLILCLGVHCMSFAQIGEEKKSAFHLSFVSPLGNNGMSSARYTNAASFNILVGISKNEKAFTFGGLSNVILNNANGLQFAGLSNYVGNEGRGVQFAGLANINKGNFSGLQFAGLVNSSAEATGVQFAGLANYSTGDMRGVQFGGLVNVADKVRGVQFSGLLNMDRGKLNGLQFAGLVNIADEVRGVQFSGLVNIAQKSDCPIGLVNIIRTGEMGVAITYDGIGNVVASFRSGGKYTYGILGVGYNHKMKSNGLVAEGGFGAHIPVTKWLRINNEIKASSIGCDANDPILNAGYSLLPAFRIGLHFELFGGASINYMQSNNMDTRNVFPDNSLWKKYGATKLQQVYIGYQVGTQFIF